MDCKIIRKGFLLPIKDLSENDVKKIKKLPKKLQKFDCRNSHIAKIENLPNGLREFICNGNQIKKIENLPGVKRVIIGSTINKRSSNRTSRQTRSADKMGSIKYQSDIDAGIKIRANTSRGTMTLYVYCKNKEIVKNFIDNINDK